MKHLRLLLLTALVCSNLRLPADTVKDREGAVRDDKTALEKDARWIYNDFQHGFTEAQRTGKPLLVVLRCVPCLACMGIDAQVLLQDTDLAPLLEKFVCVRVINANALDLSRFQFDYDLSFTVMFFNGDGTVYGRYGSWTHQKNAQDKTTAGFRRALEEALILHQGYPANKGLLAGKQGGPASFKTPVDIPTLTGKYRLELDWSGKVVPSCIHCHQIGDALRLSYRLNGEAIPPGLIYPWPEPETIGLTLVPDRPTHVESVGTSSIASRAGLQPGDDLVSLAGQPLLSVADVSWILHRAPEEGTLRAVVKRDGLEQTLLFTLPADWRSKADISRRVGTWGMRGMATGGLLLEDLSDEERHRRNLAADQLALLVKYVGEYGTHAAAKKAGFQKEDVVIEIDGLSRRLSEGELIGHLLRRHRPGAQVKTIVLRDTGRMELSLPIQ